MFEQYLEFGGTEIANAERVVKYVDRNAPQIPLRRREFSGTLHLALGEEDYQSPTADNAPWLDPSNPATARFFGVYPLAVQGGRGSTRQAQTTESIGSGGTTGAERYGSRYMRVRALLVAADMLALEAGQTWLDAALRPSDCDDHGGSCGGAKLCYYAAEPCVTDEWAPTYESAFTTPIAADVAGSPLIIREPNSDALFKARLDGSDFPPTSRADGTVLRWGTVSRANTSAEIEAYGPIIRRRTNLFTRPNFLADDAAAWWEGADFTVIDDETGPDGRAYARVPLVGGSTTLTSSTSAPIVPPAGPLIVGLDLRAPVEQNVVLELRSSADGSLIQSATFLAREDWRRFTLPRGTASAFYLQIVSTGQYDVTGITVEAGNLEFPYLDGDVAPEVAGGTYTTDKIDPEYSVEWTGAPHKSTSRMTWLGEMTVGMPLGSDYDSFAGGVCEVWPFIDVVQGEISGGRADFAVRPKVQIDDQVRPYERTMHDVRCIEGPVEIQTLPLRTGGAMRIVEFTLNAGKPWAFSTTETLLSPTKMSDLPTFEWPGTDTCDTTEPDPIVDPDCIMPPPPPRPPEIPASCVITEPTLQRYWFSIPPEKVSLWSDMVPRITIRSGAQEIRQVRVRAFPNPFGWTSGAGEFPVDPCSWCSEFIVSYLPPLTELTVDAILERAFATVDQGASQAADTLLYASDGGPMTWPALSCGIGYVFAIDVPELLLDDVTVSFDLARKE